MIVRVAIVLPICILGVFLGLYLLPVLMQLPWYYTVLVVGGGAIGLGSVFQIQTVIEKVKGLLSHLKLGHLLWFNLFIISLWIFRVRDSSQLAQNPIDPAALVRILSVAIPGIVVFSIGLAERKDVIGQLLRGLPGLMFAYGLVAFASALYSPFRSLTVYKASEIIVDVGVIAFFLSYYPSRTDMKRWIDLNWFMVALSISLVWVGAILFPHKALLRGVGILGIQIYGVMPAMNPNSIGILGAILLMASLSRALHARNQKERIMYAGFLLVGAITLVFAQARTSLFGVILAVIVVLLLNKRIKFMVFVSLLLVLGVIFSNLPSLLIKYIMRGQSTEMLFSLSGRNVWWHSAWEVFLRSPIYGYGFGVATRYVVSKGLGTLSAIHNGWLEVLINVGIIGLIPIVLVFLGTWWTLLRICLQPHSCLDKTARMLSIEMIGLLIILSVRSITGVLFTHDRETLLFLLVVGYAQQIRNCQRVWKVRQRINAHSLRIQRASG